MQNYELTIVLLGDSTAAKVKSAQEDVGKMVKTLEGKVKEENNWGKIELAYEINGSKTGVFLHYLLELEGIRAKSIKEKIKANEEVLSFLVVKSSKKIKK
jgi:ribosomal protein S6